MANPLESFKKLPAWGKIGVIAGGGLAAFLVFRAHEAAAAPAAAGASDIDPETGDVSGSPEDEAALAELQGGGGSFPVQASSGGITTTVGTTSGYPDNAAWTQAAESGLAEIGEDPQTVATALGAWLNGQPITPDQAAIVYAATAEFGDPPTGAPPVVLTSSTGPAVTGNTTTTGTGTTTTGTGTTTTPKTPALPVASGGHVVSVSNNDAKVAWTGTGATSYKVTLTGPGPENGRTGTVTVPEASYSGLEAGHTYTVTVVPIGPGGTGKSGVIPFTTTK